MFGHKMEKEQQHTENIRNSNNSDQEDEENVDPLQNHIIITKVFNCLPFKDKKNFRLVSKQWMDVTLESWRKTYSIIQLNESLKEKNLKSFLKRFQASISNNSKALGFYKIKSFPFQNFKILKADLSLKLYLDYMVVNGARLKLKDAATIDANNWSAFWFNCGPSMTSLHLLECKLRGQSQLSVIDNILLDSCPNLTTLTITEPTFIEMVSKDKDIEVNLGRRIAANLDSFTLAKFDSSSHLSAYDGHQLLKMMPNVQTLTVDLSTLSLASALPRPINMRPTTKRIPPKYAEISTLAINFTKDELNNNVPSLAFIKEYAEKVKPLPLKFIDLIVSLDQIRDPEFKFQQFLHSAKNSLEGLSLKGMKVLGVHLMKYFLFKDLNGVVFSKLTHLNLSFTGNSFIRFDFSALAGMPKLKSFICVVGDVTTRWKPEMQKKKSTTGKEKVQQHDLLKAKNIKDLGISLPDLEKFDYFVPNAKLDCLRIIASWSGNLKKLKIAFNNNESFTEAVDLWPKLEEITVYQGSSVEMELVNNDWLNGRNKRITVILNTYLCFVAFMHAVGVDDSGTLRHLHELGFANL